MFVLQVITVLTKGRKIELIPNPDTPKKDPARSPVSSQDKQDTTSVQVKVDDQEIDPTLQPTVPR